MQPRVRVAVRSWAMWAGLEGAASRAGVGALALSHPFSLHLGGGGPRCEVWARGTGEGTGRLVLCPLVRGSRVPSGRGV